MCDKKSVACNDEIQVKTENSIACNEEKSEQVRTAVVMSEIYQNQLDSKDRKIKRLSKLRNDLMEELRILKLENQNIANEIIKRGWSLEEDLYDEKTLSKHQNESAK